MGRAIGLDFGTTNSSLAVIRDDGEPGLVQFQSAAGSPTFRSLLHFERDESEGGQLEWLAGPRAIDRYLGGEAAGRLVQSLKSFLAARDFGSTNVLGEVFRLEAMIGLILRALRLEAEEQLGPIDGTIAVGRPVTFSGQKEEQDAELALARLEASLHNAGFLNVVFEYEPVAAAYFYERSLDRDELILIADFGGGTSDFSLVRVGPSRRRSGEQAEAILGTAGVPVAGDAFDGKIVRYLVAPELGMGTEYQTPFGHVLRVPGWIYGHVQRWHHLSFLKSRKTLQILLDLRREALEPEKLDALIHLVQNDLGFALYRAVEKTKLELSEGRQSRFQFRDGPVDIDLEVYRGDFDTWIWDEVEQIADCMEGLLEACSVDPGEVDRVFMTGGSSFVPAVRRLFLERFGRDKIRAGGELTSVANGLALRAAEILRQS
jgi:hypothetical chaperone protein